MFSVETLPQSIVDTKTIILKPRLDQGDVQLIGDKIKPRLFSNFGFKSKSENIELLGSEIYFEPYLIIGGKYSLDYCKKHVFRVNVEERTTKVYVAGQEFKSVQSDPRTTNRTIQMTGEEHAHHERQAYFILDRLKREIPPDKLPISPFDFQTDNTEHGSSFKSINITDEAQIEFLRTKIATRPADVAEIIREIFDITDRTIAYYPMYQLTFENMKNDAEAVVTINGITGEIIQNGTRKLAVKTIVTFPETADKGRIQTTDQKEIQANTILEIKGFHAKKETKVPQEEDEQIRSAQLAQTNACEEKQVETTLDNSSLDATSSTKDAPKEDECVQQTRSGVTESWILGFPAKIYGEVFTVGDNVTTVVGDIEVSSGADISKTLVVKGNLRIGDNCRARGKLKALKDVTVGADTAIYGDLISGGNIHVGPRTLVTGSLQAAGYIRIGECATIEGGLCSNPQTETRTDIQVLADFENVVSSVAHEI